MTEKQLVPEAQFQEATFLASVVDFLLAEIDVFERSMANDELSLQQAQAYSIVMNYQKDRLEKTVEAYKKLTKELGVSLPDPLSPE